ncbi:hypothetical protein SAMN05421787_11312 [Virgibacillus pantothenticus]|nr:hypothetical protein SAMN05421787_11312 [Virgibacillus pantothenticus]
MKELTMLYWFSHKVAGFGLNNKTGRIKSLSFTVVFTGNG